MANTMRPSSILPTIKCSDCGIEIEISKMGEHVCAKPLAEQRTTKSSAKSFFERAASFGSKSSNLLRPSKSAPPPIDSTAANKHFLSTGQLTPNSGSTKSTSTLTPSSPRPVTPRDIVKGSASSDRRPYSPPSPNQPLSQPSAYPPLAPSRSDTFTSAPGKLTPEPDRRHLYAEPDPMYAPLSPRTNGGISVMKRMDAIAPGPFTERKASSERSGQQGHQRTATALSSLSSTSSNGRGYNRPSTASSNNSRISSQSNGAAPTVPSRLRVDTELVPRPGPPPRPPRPDKVDNFLEQLQEQSGRTTSTSPVEPTLDTRAHTFPVRKDSRGPPAELQRRPSAPALETKPQEEPTVAEPSRSWYADDPHSPRPLVIQSATRHSGGSAEDEVPPLPKPLNFQKVASSSLHAPSDSGSSHTSFASSDIRSRSSVSTAPSSDASGLSRRPSKEESHILPAPHPGYNRGNAPEPFIPPAAVPVVQAPESPMDPAIQRGLFTPKTPNRQPSQANPALESVPSILRPHPPPVPQAETDPRPTSAGRSSKKGNCRGCGNAIVGKSVKAADGRLTGRYHKQCFVCQTCRAPFETADFYVFDNSPYCEHHYHQLNNSLCTCCNRGIEGQYLETERRQKFHPRCFTCVHCRVPLRDDYFDVDGKVFCERHAYAAVRQQNNMLGGGRRHPERRRTRLMMM